MSSVSKRKGDPKTGGKPFHKKSKTTASPANLSSSRTLKQQRQTHRKHAETVTQAKSLWNQLRLKTNTPQQNRALMEELMPLIEGNVHQIALQHDASRVVQAALQFGTLFERQMIIKELCKEADNIAELSKSQYAHFCVLKAIKYTHKDPVCVKLLVQGFRGHMAKLAVHAVASRVVESLFLTLSKQQAAPLQLELYGPHVSLFATPSVDTATASVSLESCLNQAPQHKQVTLDFVRNLVNKGMEKTLYGYSYFQNLVAEYVSVASPNDVRSLCNPAADHAIHLLSSRSGTRVVAALVAYGTAKDRKRILKSLKGYGRAGLLHHDAYLAILRLVQLTDDTVSVHKNLLTELLTRDDKDDNDKDGDTSVSPLLELAQSETGAKLFYLLLMTPEQLSKALDPYELSVLFADPIVLQDGKEVATSKKDAETRRSELLKYMKEPLVELCIDHADELLRSRPGSVVLRHVYQRYPSPELIAAIVAVCKVAVDVESESQQEDELSLFEHPVGHWAIKNLILVDVGNDDDQEAPFASAFCSELQGRLVHVARSNRGTFCLAALLKAPGVRDTVVQELKAHTQTLQKQAKGKGATAGFAVLLKEIS